jgi:hypothetical protein
MKYHIGKKVWIYEDNCFPAFPAVISEINSLGFSTCYRTESAQKVAPQRVYVEGYIYQSKVEAIDAMRETAHHIAKYADILEAEDE